MIKTISLALAFLAPLLLPAISFAEESLLEAVSQGNEMAAKKLLAKGADASLKKKGMDARQWAERMDHEEVVKVFEKYSHKEANPPTVSDDSKGR